MALNARQEEILARSNFKPYITTKEQQEPIYHFVVKEEHNNFGETHMTNVNWAIFDDRDQERLCLWFTQFCGPFYSGHEFIDGTINLLNGDTYLIGSLTSHEVRNLLDGKKKLMSLIESLSPEEQNKYLDYNGQCIDFYEV